MEIEFLIKRVFFSELYIFALLNGTAAVAKLVDAQR